MDIQVRLEMRGAVVPRLNILIAYTGSNMVDKHARVAGGVDNNSREGSLGLFRDDLLRKAAARYPQLMLTRFV